ncbi:MAG TPA: radical SAM protein [Candidatus Omnitrophica bacterium]|nr:radical SAM protein [Candidatus Omnitrophota bacterium]
MKKEIITIILMSIILGFWMPSLEARRIKELESAKDFRYVYGPVSSWRLGSSLGIDPVSGNVAKICSFDCIYCQAGPTQVLTLERKVYVDTKLIVDEVAKRLKSGITPDYITFAGRGEPTLARNLGEIIIELKKITTIPIAVLSNASLIFDPDVQNDLLEADFVILKIDAFDDLSFLKMNRPHSALLFQDIVNGIIDFRQKYKGRLGIQIMFTDLNKEEAEQIAHIVARMAPDQIQLNTPLRPRLSDLTEKARELTPEEMREIKEVFEKICPGVEIVMVYDYID